VSLLVGIAMALVVVVTVTLVLAFRPNHNAATPSPPELHAVAYSPDGKQIATGGIGSDPETVRLWNTVSWQLTTITLGNFTVYDLAFSPDGRILAVACDDGLRLYNADTHTLIAGPIAVSSNTRLHGSDSLAFSPDGKALAVGDFDGSIRILDLTTNSQLYPVMTGHTGSIDGLAFSPDGKVLASAGGTVTNEDNSYSYDGSVRLWDTGTRQQLGDPLINERASTTALSVSFAPQGERLAVGYGARDNLIWNIGTRKPVGTLAGTYGLGTAITYSHTGSLIAAGNGNDVRVWNADTTKLVRDLKGHTNTVSGLAFSPDDSRLASSSNDGTVRVWDPATGQLLKQLNA
jgi:WD40 repeat protein